MRKPNRIRANNEAWLTSYADLITNLLIFFVLIISASQIQTGKMEKIIQSMTEGVISEESLPAAKEKLSQALKKENLSEQDVSVQLTDEGLELSFNSGVTFASGSADILSSMENSLQKVLLVLKPYSQKYHFAIEGHTDEMPISSAQFKSNWELASARAMQLRERLEGTGVPSNKIRVEAYANFKPLPEEVLKNLDQASRLAKHRRVTIRLF